MTRKGRRRPADAVGFTETVEGENWAKRRRGASSVGAAETARQKFLSPLRAAPGASTEESDEDEDEVEDVESESPESSSTEESDKDEDEDEDDDEDVESESPEAWSDVPSSKASMVSRAPALTTTLELEEGGRDGAVGRRLAANPRQRRKP